ncbi:MAG: molybdenum cofactor guanylyltransferase MobA [Pseudomonadota bacterium]
MIERTGVLGAIIAGGEGSRMGGMNKPLMVLGGKPLIAHAVARLKTQAPNLIINANRDHDEISKALPGGTKIVSDDAEYTGRGPLAGVHACLREAAALDATHMVTIAADTPFFPLNFVDMLAAPDGRGAIRIANHGGYRHPLFALWPVSILDDLEHFLADSEINKVTAFATRHTVIDVPFADDDDDPFFNINTREDLALAQARLMGHAA